MLTPLFTGDLVRLCAPRPEDKHDFAMWSQDDVYLRLQDDDPCRPASPASFSQFDEARKGENSYFHIRTLADDQLLGFVVLFNIQWSNQSATLAIGIGDAAFRGKGYGSDTLRLIIRYGFSELGLHRIGLTVIAYNKAAIKAYERAGFKHEGTLREAIYRQDQRYDMLYYGILRHEWRAQEASQ